MDSVGDLACLSACGRRAYLNDDRDQVNSLDVVVDSSANCEVFVHGLAVSDDGNSTVTGFSPNERLGVGIPSPNPPYLPADGPFGNYHSITRCNTRKDTRASFFLG